MQLKSDDHIRGRVMGIWSMVLSGAYPLGHLLAGRAADSWLDQTSPGGMLAQVLAVQPGERGGVALVLALMGVGIAAASTVVLVLALVGRCRERTSPQKS
jgi:hypothetical protein